MAYTDATYDSFPGAEVCPPGVTPGANGTCDLAGLPLIYAPEEKGSIYANLYFPDAVGQWDLSVNADVNYSSDAFTDISYGEDTISESRTVWNAGLRLVSPSERYTISLLGKKPWRRSVLCMVCAIGTKHYCNDEYSARTCT